MMRTMVMTTVMGAGLFLGGCGGGLKSYEITVKYADTNAAAAPRTVALAGFRGVPTDHVMAKAGNAWLLDAKAKTDAKAMTIVLNSGAPASVLAKNDAKWTEWKSEKGEKPEYVWAFANGSGRQDEVKVLLPLHAKAWDGDKIILNVDADGNLKIDPSTPRKLDRNPPE